MTLHTIGAAIRAESHEATQGMEVIFHTPSLERPGGKVAGMSSRCFEKNDIKETT